MYLNEERSESPAVAIELAARLVRRIDGGMVDWRALSVSDLDCALLMLRQTIIGDRIATDARCAKDGCGARADVAFSIREYLKSRKPSTPRNVKQIGEGVWFSIETKAGAAEFRLPSGDDLLQIGGQATPWRELERRCIRPESSVDRFRAPIERAMESLAPRYSSIVSGECPECGHAFEYYFDVLRFVTREMRAYAGTVYQDVHLLASHYKWPEQDILGLPRSRRIAYAGMLGGGVTA